MDKNSQDITKCPFHYGTMKRRCLEQGDNLDRCDIK